MKYNHIVFRAEADGVDSGCVPSVFPYVLTLYDVGEHDVFIASSTNKLRIVFADVNWINIVVVDIFIVFDHEIFRGVVEADAAVFWASHAVLTLVIEFDCVDWSCVYLDQLFGLIGQFVCFAAAHGYIFNLL